ncbi:hypothetical protein BH20ACT15_BH20ACT15_05660 [soil metagenome]
MTDTDFDFDFDVDRDAGPEEPGSDPDAPEANGSNGHSPDGSENRSRNGARDGSNGGGSGRPPPAYEDGDANGSRDRDEDDDWLSTGEGDFEEMLSHQPQKSEVAKRGAAVLYGLRGLLDDGRERLRGGRAKVGELRERVPDSLPRPSTGGEGSGRGGSRFGRIGGSNGNGAPPKLPAKISSRRPRKPQPGRVKKLRLAIILVGLGSLAMVSTVFGMMMSVSRDLPQLETKEQYAQAKNSEVFDSQGRKMGTLLSNSGRILVESEDINPYMKQAVVAIEDKRFFEHDGVDFRGIGRALVADLMPGGSTQGASTITQQFVKNALEAQGSRTVFQKLRESALAYHLERQWDKDKILTQYLNTIYFGEGAYGIEAAARTYFGKAHPECQIEGADPCASVLAPEEAAMLAGIITSPSAFSPRANPQDATGRRNTVLQKMVEQDTLTEDQFNDAAQTTVPAPSDIERPAPDSLSPYFTEWLRQQLVDKYGAGRAFGGGLDVKTTLDLDIQEAAEGAAFDTLAGIEPTASVVVIDNDTGGVKAMVGGNDFQDEPFNLATNGHRQPGSSFKPFTLITAFENGFGPGSTFTSEKRVFTVPNSGGSEKFEVNNYDDIYYGTSDLVSATLHSDNSIFAELGFGSQGLGRKGPKKVGKTAERMGISPDSFDTNPAMILGGIDPGVTPLEMAYAFSTISRGGLRIGGELDSTPGPNNKLEDLGPVAIREVTKPDGSILDGGKNQELKTLRAIPENVADTTKDILRQNVLSGTGEQAQTGDYAWGKTGTTDNNGDAWFCGGSEHFTTCVWVGHAQTNTPMETEFGGQPVDGGTFPALIWSQVMQAAESIRASRKDDDEDSSGDTSNSAPSSSSGSSSSGSSGGSGGSGSGGSGGGGDSGQSAPAPTPAPAPSGGGGGAPSGTGGTGL